jgi:hypothetical protein
MIVRDFNLERIVTTPHKTDSILIVDPNTVLPLPISAEPLQFVPRGTFQILQSYCIVEHG